jgi:cytochrome c
VDSYEWNKIFGWVLAAAIAVLGLSILTGAVYPVGRPDKMGYIVEGVEEEASAAVAGPAAQPIAMFIAEAKMPKGEAQFKKCAACHTIDKGGPNNQGPNLYGILGAKVARAAGFAYSDALKTHGGTWGWDELNAWLESPRKFIPGNKMSFAGISKPEDRADLLAYLNSKSDSPLPLPAMPAVAEAAPAGDAVAAGAVAEAPVAAPADGAAAETPAQ